MYLAEHNNIPRQSGIFEAKITSPRQACVISELPVYCCVLSGVPISSLWWTLGSYTVLVKAGLSFSAAAELETDYDGRLLEGRLRN